MDKLYLLSCSPSSALEDLLRDLERSDLGGGDRDLEPLGEAVGDLAGDLECLGVGDLDFLGGGGVGDLDLECLGVGDLDFLGGGGVGDLDLLLRTGDLDLLRELK